MFSWLERNPFFFTVVFLVVFSIAGLVELLPDFAQASRPTEGLKPYSMLETAGRQVYIKESCNACHSQMIRPFKSETDRYGMYSLSGEYAYDRPFLWGSKRTGPDLHRVGDYRTTDWHETHMLDPLSVVPGSIMPAYAHHFTNLVSIETAYAEAYTQKVVFGMPYDRDLNGDGTPDVPLNEDASGKEEGFGIARAHMLKEARAVVADMKSPEVRAAVERGEVPEIVALIAYLNSLGTKRRAQ